MTFKVVVYCNMKIGRYPISKRIFDLIITLIGMIIALPLMGIIALLVRIKIGSPILFKQQRPGLNEKIFTLYKFRTMINRYDADGKPAADADRLTLFGEKLRSSSLDELPELFCVIKGDMSLVGPRPLLIQYLPLYSDEQRRRHLLPPGITGWAQINGRNAITWEDKFRLDIWYVDHWSLWLDIKILLKTIGKVIKREGISSQNHVTMEEFKG